MATIERSARVWLLYLKRQQGQRGTLSANITREVCEYLADPLLVHVTKTFLSFFNFPTSTWGSQVNLKATIQVSIDSRWVILEGGRVFVCGG